MLQSNYDARGPAEDVDTSPRLSSVRYGVNGSSLDTDTRHSDLDGVNSGVNSGSSVDFSDSLDTKHISPAVPRTRSGFVPAPTRGFRAAAYNIGLGFSDKIGLVLNRANQLSIDMLALTEVGDPRVNDRLIQSYGYRYIACLKRHAGVMLLFRSDLAASLRKPMDSSTSGRLVGGVFEIAGKTSLIVSAYLPSGLDGKSESSDEAADAKDIYRCIGRWSALADNTLVLGDLNETVSDRIGLKILQEYGIVASSPPCSTLASRTASAHCTAKAASPAKRLFLGGWRSRELIMCWLKGGEAPLHEPVQSTTFWLSLVINCSGQMLARPM